MNPLQLASTVASLGGVALSNKVLAASWKKITGNEPPQKNPDDSERWRDIIIWSMISGTIATIIKVAVARQATKMDAKRGNSDQSEI